MAGGQLISKRSYRTFLSHAHSDKTIVDALYEWAQRSAGIKVWYDSVEFPTGLVATELARAILDCQSAIVVLSERSITSGWVKQEWNICIGQQSEFPDFQILPVRVDDCTPPPELGIHKWIDLGQQGLTPTTATQILEALHWHETEPAGVGRRQVYFARGSKTPDEATAANDLRQQLRASGLRVVRDAPDQYRFEDKRIRSIMQSCAGFVVLLSHRGEGKTSPYFLRELRIATTLGLPVLALVEDPVTEAVDAGGQGKVVRIGSLTAAASSAMKKTIEDFADALGDPPRPAHCFFGHAFTGPDLELYAFARRCVQSTAGVACISGDEVLGGDAQEQIAARIRDATFCLFDITDDRLNSCVEAGVAIGAGTPFEIISKGPRRTPPYMFRGRQLWTYADGTELIGLVRKLSLPFCRVVN